MRWILGLLFTLNATNAALAWGPQGHMIVGEVAEHQLTDKARTAVKKILGGQSLASVSNWADTIKGQAEWVKSKPWHFVDIPDGQTYDTVPHPAEGNVITAITQMVSVLKSSSAPQSEKQNALKFIIHFVGDMHQPLHVGRPSDRGGNSIRLVFDGNSTNLHQLWDSGMISKQNLDYQQYAHYLEGQAQLTSYEIPEIPFKQIISEDMAARGQIYSFRALNDAPITLDLAYMNRNIQTMNERLLSGGKRLAGLLNSLYK